jgi:hypothetical protein
MDGVTFQGTGFENRVSEEVGAATVRALAVTAYFEEEVPEQTESRKRCLITLLLIPKYASQVH